MKRQICRNERCVRVELHYAHRSKRYRMSAKRLRADAARRPKAEAKHVAEAILMRRRAVASRGYLPSEIVFSEAGSVLLLRWRCPAHRADRCSICKGAGEVTASYDDMFSLLLQEKLL